MNNDSLRTENLTLCEERAKILTELLTVFIDLLNEAKCYYHLYPNSHRATVEEYSGESL